MTRGGATKNREQPERRCVVTGVSGGVAGLLRFVLDPDGVVTPDLAEKLPGRGVWVSADRAAVERAVAKNLFARSARAPAQAPADLADQVERLLARRLIEAIALCRKAGLAVCGFEKTREAASRAAALVQASDGAEGGKAKVRRLVKSRIEISCLDSAELGLAFGRLSVIHAALIVGGASDRAIREAQRLQGFRRCGAFGVDESLAASGSERAAAADRDAERALEQGAGTGGAETGDTKTGDTGPGDTGPGGAGS